MPISAGLRIAAEVRSPVRTISQLIPRLLTSPRLPRSSTQFQLAAVRAQTRLLWGVRKPLRNRSRVKVFLVVVRAQANHLITVLDLTGVNGVHLLVGVILTDPLGGSVIIYGSLGVRLPHPDGERRFFRAATHDLALHASLFRRVLREAGYRHREDKHDHEQHSCHFLQHVTFSSRS